jgi:uncharacterized membrane protein YebE (DUF533 family)
MKKILSAIIIALFASASLLPVYAQDKNPKDNTPKVNRRQNRQEKRIQEGAKSGELTREEAAKLKAEQEAIQAQKRAAKSDGVVTKKERKSIKTNQKEAGKDIKKERNDKQTR